MGEILKFGGERVKEAVYLLIRRAYELEEVPKDWSRGIIFPIFKGKSESERRDPKNYRGITLLSIVSRVYMSILNTRISKWCEKRESFTETQAAFRKNRSPMDQLFILTEVIRSRFPQASFCGFLILRKHMIECFARDYWWSCGTKVFVARVGEFFAICTEK